MPNKLFKDPTEYPDVVNESQNGFSVDVLIYSKKMDLHTVGFFHFNELRWVFMNNEIITEFKWRYFAENTDYYE